MVTITDKVYDKLAKENLRSHHYPGMFVLGKNDKGIIVTAIRVQVYGGCSQSGRIEPGQMSKAMIKLVNGNLIPCGVARVSRSINYEPGDNYHRGAGFGDVTSKNGRAVFITMNGRYLYVDRKKKGRRRLEMVNVIPEGRINGKKN